MKLIGSLITAGLLVSVSAPVFASIEIASKNACMGCHAIDKKVVGPSYKDIAAKYKGHPDAVEKLAKKVKAGGSGVWGPVPMPGNSRISVADAKTVVQWILDEKVNSIKDSINEDRKNNSMQETKCLRLGLSKNSFDYKLCMNSAPPD